MNLGVGVYLVLALIWLGLAGYFFFVSEPRAFGMIDAHVAGILSCILAVWNGSRAIMQWRKARPEAESHDRPF